MSVRGSRKGISSGKTSFGTRASFVRGCTTSDIKRPNFFIRSPPNHVLPSLAELNNLWFAFPIYHFLITDLPQHGHLEAGSPTAKQPLMPSCASSKALDDAVSGLLHSAFSGDATVD